MRAEDRVEDGGDGAVQDGVEGVAEVGGEKENRVEEKGGAKADDQGIAVCGGREEGSPGVNMAEIAALAQVSIFVPLSSRGGWEDGNEEEGLTGRTRLRTLPASSLRGPARPA